MLMALSTFVFDLPTLAYQQFQRQMQWRYGSSERIGARAAYQYLGVGEETIELTGLVAPEFTGTTASIDTLRDMADTGEPFPLVEGTGVVYGSYVITAVNATHSLFWPDGSPRRVEFTLSLKRVDTPAQKQARSA